ncbi:MULTISPECIES: indole-3-glycerol phosphate synthase TrpC [Leptolyngbya]|jgi:indole-3-glycerol phosphate synthase|uniref:Indole-3-glycerol phosphate synthase n=1 Tax=Leptolyngbya boryana NIES-2135 TaxID=1973484 RepID=A0A1Z4JJ37_LEPBY|nr:MULTISPECIES: indole-3-glycerol phosphate synthase TrpC [Leptolyngbya]BAY56750.1 indole-3-glycerol-phosphate synthase [Leptolyngbya boryana NIES-2135]MBD2370634.1 indole-3-glycerol phosphate synthase TrpC [Leptolyngbya sp. FACHB-161]MBD2377946.1 indole-3-glycerol phosphate synthase TrpC [Leptolyngbya sp. FACHB-238]MBD2401424.1 indole-3-glycerol phosphate synthase TrpC [Leptolyngbya sp. FACHB-239]MBD2407975.1 indole-3-glycerol phosphate synthase TrpC [Leptolyngbya sp. FACHB-402]
MEIRRRPPNPSIAVEELRYQIKTPNSEPANILEEIIWHKETEVDQLREKLPLSELQRKLKDAPAPKDFLAALRNNPKKPAVIAEVKKASPSKGVIREDFDPVAIAKSYQSGGASCLSVLTDTKFFQGSFQYLAQIREVVDIPLLCKDFIIYPYQMQWARLHGADAVLLIAAVLSDQDLQYFLKIVKALGMTALIEVHTLAELDRVLNLDGATLIGINNRNLKDFSVDLKTTEDILQARLTTLSARNITVVSESGLYTAEDLARVGKAGASAVLIGESLVKQPDPGQALAQLIQD